MGALLIQVEAELLQLQIVGDQLLLLIVQLPQFVLGGASKYVNNRENDTELLSSICNYVAALLSSICNYSETI